MLDMDWGGRLLLVIVTAFIGVSEGAQDRDYQLVLEDAEIYRIDTKYVGDHSYLEIGDKDDKPVVNGEIEFKDDLPPETEVWWEIYTKDENNEEILKANGPKTTLCKFVKDQKPMADMVITYSNLPTECPFAKGKYYIKNALLDNSVFPVKIPKDKVSYKLLMNFFVDSKPILLFWIESLVIWSQ